MRVTIRIATAAVGLAIYGWTGCGNAVRAADPVPHPPVIAAEAVMPDEGFGAWYLRGDIGIAAPLAPGMSWQSASYGNRTAAGAANLGSGIGYRFNDTLRADLTLDYLTSHAVKGYLSAAVADRLTQDDTLLLANGYYDIGTFAGLTPYVGAGLGLARVDSDPLVRTVNGVNAFTFAGAIRYSLAAAAATGISFDIGRGLQADVGYRFTWIGKTRTGAETTATLPGTVGLGDNGVHQFRVGVRYSLD